MAGAIPEPNPLDAVLRVRGLPAVGASRAANGRVDQPRPAGDPLTGERRLVPVGLTFDRDQPEMPYGSGPGESTLVPVLLNRSSILPARNSIAMIRRIAIEAMMRPYSTSP